MELIQIIYNILLFGGALVLFIMIVSYILSKYRNIEKNNNKRTEIGILSDQTLRTRINYQNQVASILPSNHLQLEQSEFRHHLVQSKPRIFPIDQIHLREVKIVRKPTVREEQKTRTIENKLSINKRYTIVNESQRKPNSRVINFYL